MNRTLRSIRRTVATIIFSLLIMSEAVLVCSAEEFSKGDVNKDGTINVTDITLVAAHVKGIRPLPSEYQDTADYNDDGDINVSDISGIAAIVKGISAEKKDDENKYTSTENSPSYLFLKENYNGMVRSKQLDPNSNNGVLYDNLYYGYQINDDTYRLFCRNTYTDVPKKYINDGVFVSNKLSPQ